MIGLLIGLFVACFHDYRYKKIPNWVIVLLFSWGCVCAWNYGGLFYLIEYIYVGLLIILVFFPFFRLGMLGAGDIKLLGVCSPFFPSEKILAFLFFTMAISAFFSIIKMIRFKNFKERFSYFLQYISECMESKSWKLYMRTSEEKKKNTICMAGPVLLSTLFYLGGFY